MIGEMSSSSGVFVATGGSNRLMTEAEFDSFYRKNGRALMSYITKLCGDPTTAEDLFQRTVIQFLRVPLPVDDDDQLRAYVYRVATNVAHDHWRRSRKEVSLEDHDLPDDSRGATEQELRHDVQKVMRGLSPQERALLWFAHVEERDHREIAVRVGVKEKSVKVLLFRARRKLAALIEQKGLGGTR